MAGIATRDLKAVGDYTPTWTPRSSYPVNGVNWPAIGTYDMNSYRSKNYYDATHNGATSPTYATFSAGAITLNDFLNKSYKDEWACNCADCANCACTK